MRVLEIEEIEDKEQKEKQKEKRRILEKDIVERARGKNWLRIVLAFVFMASFLLIKSAIGMPNNIAHVSVSLFLAGFCTSCFYHVIPFLLAKCYFLLLQDQKVRELPF